MPTYTKKCSDCDTEFDLMCKIADKELPKTCPNCGSIESAYMLSAPYATIRSDRLMTHKKDAGFGEVLSRIKERHPRTNLATGRNNGETSMD